MDSDKEENDLVESSGFEQIIDDSPLKRAQTRKKDDKTERQQPVTPKLSPKGSDVIGPMSTLNTISNNYTDDEIHTASKNIDDLDDVFDMVSQFEENYQDTKKRINKMEKANQQCNILPQIIKMCF